MKCSWLCVHLNSGHERFYIIKWNCIKCSVDYEKKERAKQINQLAYLEPYIYRWNTSNTYYKKSSRNRNEYAFARSKCACMCVHMHRRLVSMNLETSSPVVVCYTNLPSPSRRCPFRGLSPSSLTSSSLLSSTRSMSAQLPLFLRSFKKS